MIRSAKHLIHVVLLSAICTLYFVSSSPADVPNTPSSFSADRLDALAASSECQDRCDITFGDEEYQIIFLTQPNAPADFAVIKQMNPPCGSAGCPTSLYKREQNNWLRVTEELGVRVVNNRTNGFPDLQRSFWPRDAPRAQSVYLTYAWDGNNFIPQYFKTADNCIGFFLSEINQPFPLSQREWSGSCVDGLLHGVGALKYPPRGGPEYYFYKGFMISFVNNSHIHGPASAELCFEFLSDLKLDLKKIGEGLYFSIGESDGVQYFSELKRFRSHSGCQFGPIGGEFGSAVLNQRPRLAYPEKSLALVDSNISLLQYADNSVEDHIFNSYLGHWTKFVEERSAILLSPIDPRHQNRSEREGSGDSPFRASPRLSFGQWSHNTRDGYHLLISYSVDGDIGYSRPQMVKNEIEKQIRVSQLLDDLKNFKERNGIEEWPVSGIVNSNPFIFQDKTIGIQARFVRMIQNDQALFRIGENVEIVGEALVALQMMDVDRILLAFRSKGNANFARLGGRLLTHGEVVDILIIPDVLDVSFGLPGDDLR